RGPAAWARACPFRTRSCSVLGIATGTETGTTRNIRSGRRSVRRLCEGRCDALRRGDVIRVARALLPGVERAEHHALPYSAAGERAANGGRDISPDAQGFFAGRVGGLTRQSSDCRRSCTFPRHHAQHPRSEPRLGPALFHESTALCLLRDAFDVFRART